MLYLVAQLCPPLCDPMNCSSPGFSVHGFLQARILEWSPFPSPGDLPDPGMKPRSPTLQTNSLLSEPPSQSVSSVAQTCPTLCDPMNCSTPGLLSITNSQSSPKLTSIELVMPSRHLILCPPLLLLPSIPHRIRVFSNELTLHMRWPKYWSFSFSVIPSKEIPGLISLQSKGLSRVFSNTTVQKHQFFSAQPSSQSNSRIHG